LVLFLGRGDHIFSDLVAPAKAAHWQTVAIIDEVARETQLHDSESFQALLRTMVTVEDLLARGRLLPPSDEVIEDIKLLKDIRNNCRQHMKAVFNPRSVVLSLRWKPRRLSNSLF